MNNPYVGPRSFQFGETLYGRSREVADLVDLLISERIVLLYSPSGAGKTSLIQASLKPELEDEDFHLLGTARVSREFDQIDHINHYVFSLLLCFEEHLPTEQQLSLEELSKLDIPAWFQLRQTLWPKEKSPLIIIDQFEEILTQHPEEIKEKEAFFQQLGQVLNQRNLWALFSMREDFLAGLDNYLRLIPTRLKSRYRLALLSTRAAREAIRQPAIKAGIEFDEDAADLLVKNLCQIRVQQTNGEVILKPGPHVEPVQLQVVCVRLWLNLEGDHIDREQVSLLGDVDSALSNYYAEEVAKIAACNAISEREIRDWCGQHLITEQGLRAQVLRGAETSDQMRDAILGLLDAHLLRAESHRGAIWYELAHDRLVSPILENNEQWNEKHLSLVQRQAQAWELGARDDALLLTNDALTEAQRWAAQNKLNETETEFIQRCTEIQNISVRKKRLQRYQYLTLLFFAISSFVFAAYMNRQHKQVLQKKQLVEQRYQEADQKQREVSKALLLAKQEADDAQRAKQEAERNAQHLLKQTEQEVTELKTENQKKIDEQNREIELLQQEANQKLEIAESKAEQLRQQSQQTISNANRQKDEARKKQENAQRELKRANLLGLARNLAVLAPNLEESHPELAAILALRAWSINREYASEERISQIYEALSGARVALDPSADDHLGLHQDAIRRLATTPQGMIASADDLGEIHIRKGKATPQKLELNEPIRALAYHADGGLVAAGSRGSLALFRAGNETRVNLPLGIKAMALHQNVCALLDREGRLQIRNYPSLTPHQDLNLSGVTALAFSQKGTLAISRPGEMLLLDAPYEDRNIRTITTNMTVVCLAFDRHAQYLAAGSNDGIIQVQNIHSNRSFSLMGHFGQINDLCFSPREHLLASAGHDGTVRLWNLAAANRAEPVVFKDHQRWVWALAFSPDGSWIYSGGSDNKLRQRSVIVSNFVAQLCTTIKPEHLALLNQLEPLLSAEEWALFKEMTYEQICP